MLRRRAGALRLLTSWMLFAASCAPNSSLPERDELCDPGTYIYCRCPGGQPGSKLCNGDGQSFTACELQAGGPCPDREGGEGGAGLGGASSGVGNEGPGPGGAGGGAGALPLLAACQADADCASGLCPMRFCTKPCAAVGDCPSDVSECVDFAVEELCLPTCGTLEAPNPTSCGQFGPGSDCGYAAAVDGWKVATCADWGEFLELPPQGTECGPGVIGNVQCNLGHQGLEAVCTDNGVCVRGCYGEGDCTPPESCSGANDSVGKCL